MAEGIDEATNAFQAALNPAAVEAPPAPKGKPERMFGDPGGLIDGEPGDSEDSEGTLEGYEGEEEDEPAPKAKKDAGPLNPDDGEEEDEDSPDGDEEDGDDPEYTIMVDGEETTVKLSEALNGYTRTKTFHQRIQKLNEAAEALHAEGEKIVADRQRYIGLINDMELELKELIPAEPNWDELYASDAVGARKLQTQYENFNKKRAELADKKAKAIKEAQEEHQKNTANYAKSEFSLFIQNNKIRDKAELDKELASMRKTAVNAGFSEQEVAVVYDSRMLTLLRKASKYDRMMAARPKPVTVDGKKTIAPGATTAAKRSAPKGVDRAQRRLAQTGSVHDAAEVFRKLI